ncbi:hypothetical protein V565_093870 [Rhizoctonia solani 123E]|uniref:Uncharacterized protein n=1 Tax=Rhizoctonia solani 123E TaxID=1423351 RepID=A0A074RWV8_9AGAM|nr:hypothetical protein V565_093870 [Rhizoctonia solani 123E]
MDRTHSDLIYYKLRTVQISPKDPSGSIPKRKRLNSLLPNFGTISYSEMLCVRDSEIVPGKPNTAIVVFALQHSVESILESSRRDKSGSFWKKESIKAHTLDKKSPVADFFLTTIVPKLGSESESAADEESSDASDAEIQSAHSDQDNSVSPAKRRRTQSWGTSDGATAARIARLEEDLNTARIDRDRAISQQVVSQMAYEKVMVQNSIFAARLAQEETEKRQLSIGIQEIQSHGSALLNEVNTLRGQLTAAEETLRQEQPYPEESSERIKALKKELEEASDREQKLLLQKSHLEQHKNAFETELNDSKEKLHKSSAEVEQLKVDLAFTHEQLNAIERSLESMEKKYSLTRRMYESTKAKLDMYKSRHENEQTTVQKLKDTLTPEVYRSLGAAYENLGAFLAITGLPPMDHEGYAEPKKESDRSSIVQSM